MRLKWNRYRFQVVFFWFWGLMACGGAEPRPECTESEEVFVNFRASADLNRDLEGNPRSTHLQVFQLSVISVLEQGSFSALWTEPKSLLADALLDGPRKLTLNPGGYMARRLIRHPDARAILIVGNFRQIQGDSRWYSQVALPPPGDPCATYKKGKQPPPMTVNVLLDKYQIYFKANFQAPVYEHRPVGTQPSPVVNDADWPDPNVQPPPPKPVFRPRQPVAQPRPAPRRTEPPPRPAASEPKERTGPARNPRLRRKKKKEQPPPPPQRQESEVPLL